MLPGATPDTYLRGRLSGVLSAAGGLWMIDQDAALTVISEISLRFLPSTVPSVVIHTRTLDVGAALFTEMVFDPGFIGVGGLSSVVSFSDDGDELCADRIWIAVPVLLRLIVTEPITVGCGS